MQNDAGPSELIALAAREDAAAAVEAERRRLAVLLQSRIVEPLSLLLAQAGTYEQAATDPQARLAVSVLASLARQVLQKVRDLESDLHPVALDALGLGPALEMLAGQMMRAYGLQITLAIDRRLERLPRSLELALFRASQDSLDRARAARATHIVIRLLAVDALALTISDNSSDHRADSLRPAIERLAQLGVQMKTGTTPDGFTVAIHVPLAAPVALTPREMETLKLLASGMSNKAIARALSVSPRTVNFHLDNLYSKLGVRSRTEAAVYALRQGWVTSTPATDPVQEGLPRPPS